MRHSDTGQTLTSQFKWAIKSDLFGFRDTFALLSFVIVCDVDEEEEKEEEVEVLEVEGWDTMLFVMVMVFAFDC